MTPGLDIYRTAKLLIDQHRDEAPIHTAMRADAMLDKGDLDGAAVWRRIVSAVNELLADKGDLDGAAVWRRIVSAVNELLADKPADGTRIH